MEVTLFDTKRPWERSKRVSDKIFQEQAKRAKEAADQIQLR
jgi:hypothetical protein